MTDKIYSKKRTKTKIKTKRKLFKRITICGCEKWKGKKNNNKSMSFKGCTLNEINYRLLYDLTLVVSNLMKKRKKNM